LGITHAQRSDGCGSPNSHQWKYPGGHVQQYRVGGVGDCGGDVVVGVDVVVGAGVVVGGLVGVKVVVGATVVDGAEVGD